MFKMYDLNMNEIRFPEGFIPLDIFISSVDKERITDKVEGSNRKINYGSVYNERDIQLSILLKAHDTQDYRLLRDETYALFNRFDTFYVVEKHTRGKRYLVSVDEKFIPDRMPGNQRFADVTINCVMPGLPFVESIGRTSDITGNALKYSDELWSYGMGLSYDEESHKYIHAAKSFQIYNAGNVTVHPFEQDLEVIISNPTKGYQLKNETTGDVFKYTGTASGRIVLDGPNVTVNSLQALRDTNRKFITLAPGWNTFTQNQTREVKFNFRFYYK